MFKETYPVDSGVEMGAEMPKWSVSLEKPRSLSERLKSALKPTEPEVEEIPTSGVERVSTASIHESLEGMIAKGNTNATELAHSLGDKVDGNLMDTARNTVTHPISKALIITGFNIGAKAAGVKFFTDSGQFLHQNQEVKKVRIDALAVLMGEDIVAIKHEQAVQMLANMERAQQLSPKELAIFRTSLKEIDEGYDTADQEKQYEDLLKNFVNTKITGMGLVSEGINTLMVPTGLALARAGVMFTMKGIEIVYKSVQENKRAAASGEKHEHIALTVLNKIKEGALSTITAGQIGMEGKNKTERTVKAIGALGILAGAFGFGAAGAREWAEGGKHASDALELLQKNGLQQLSDGWTATAGAAFKALGHPIDTMSAIWAGVAKRLGSGEALQAGPTHEATAGTTADAAKLSTDIHSRFTDAHKADSERKALGMSGDVV